MISDGGERRKQRWRKGESDLGSKVVRVLSDNCVARDAGGSWREEDGEDHAKSMQRNGLD